MTAIDTVRKAAEALGPVRLVGGEYLINCPSPDHIDKHPSCYFCAKDDGRVVINCRSQGCTFKAMAEGLGLKEQDFFPPNTETPKRKGRGPLVATFLYESIFGKLAFKSCRYQFPGSADKTFLLFRPDGNGRWIAGIKGFVEPIPYRLPELNAADPEESIFIVEGEKCVDLARTKLGIVATTNPGGSGSSNLWKTPAFAKPVKGKNIAIIPDNDEPGEKHVATVAQLIVGVAKSIKIVRLPLKAEGDDIEQWIKAGGTREQLFALVEATPVYSGEAATPEEPESICLATIEPRRNRWLWIGRLASGEMVIITGPPGTGKGLLLCYIVARFTTSRPMYGDIEASSAGNVLWISIEDAHDTSLAPRLIAAGADRTRVFVWDMNRPLSLPTDAARIIAEVKRHNCEILIIDPAPTLLDKDHSSNNDANVRQSFCELATTCRELGCALILVRHTNKRQTGTAMDRGGGSIGWSGMARIELMLGRRVANEDATTVDVDESVVTLATVKNNLGKWAPSLNCRIVEAGESARLEIIGETQTKADDLFAQEKPRTSHKSADAEKVIRHALANGEWHRQTEVDDAAKDAGISRGTLNRAKRSLCVETRKLGAVFWWRLPRQDDHRGQCDGHDHHDHDATGEGEADHHHSNNISKLEVQDDHGDQGTHTPQGDHLPEDDADLDADFRGDLNPEDAV